MRNLSYQDSDCGHISRGATLEPPTHVEINGLIHHYDRRATADARRQRRGFILAPGSMTIEEHDITAGRHTPSHVSAAMKTTSSQAADQIDEIIWPSGKYHVNHQFSRHRISV